MLKRLAALTVSVLLPLSPLSSAAQNPGGGPGYVIGYINGLSTDPIGAQDGLDALSAVYGTQYNNQPVSYTLFYTPTDGLTQDVINAFAQRVASSPGLTDRWELIWDTLDGGGAISDLAIAENPSLNSLVSDLKTTFLNGVSSNVKNLNSNKEFQPAVDQFASALTTSASSSTLTITSRVVRLPLPPGRIPLSIPSPTRYGSDRYAADRTQISKPASAICQRYGRASSASSRRLRLRSRPATLAENSSISSDATPRQRSAGATVLKRAPLPRCARTPGRGARDRDRSTS